MKEVEHMDIVLRLETPADYAETEKVVREAFWNVYAPGCTEHYLVHVMRSSENFMRELAFVAGCRQQDSRLRDVREGNDSG